MRATLSYEAVAKGFAPRLIETTNLCPKCAMAEATVEATGFCQACTGADLAERYEERETREAEARNRAWRERDRIRQRHHRLMVELRPAELALPQTDPLELG